jgi:hypothetical protein
MVRAFVAVFFRAFCVVICRFAFIYPRFTPVSSLLPPKTTAKRLNYGL